MKAISLWQPWASAMAVDAKHNETRSWYMVHRGDLVICSAKRKPTLADVDGDKQLLEQALAVPFGFALCVVEVYDCKHSEYFTTEERRKTQVFPGSLTEPPIVISEQEWSLGDYSPHRFIAMTRNLRRLKTPVPVVGRQGMFYLPPDVEAKVREQL